MLEAFVMYSMNMIYIVGILSLIISLLSYLYLPKAMRILFDQDTSEGDKNEWGRYTNLLCNNLLVDRANL